MDVDLWIKEEGDGSADKPLFCGYVELDTYLSGFDSKFLGWFQGDCHGVDMHYTFLRKVIETVVEVLAEAGYLSDMNSVLQPVVLMMRFHYMMMVPFVKVGECSSILWLWIRKMKCRLF
jgi:hypothetical protein